MLNISHTYPNGYTYLAICPSCGSKDTFSFNLKYKTCKCWKATCSLSGRTSLFDFANRYNLKKDFEDYYGIPLSRLNDSHNIVTTIEVRKEVSEEDFWSRYVPFEENDTSSSFKYLLKRGISVENIQRFQLGRTSDDTAVMIPFYQYKRTNKGFNAVLKFYQLRYTNPTKYQPKYFNPKDVDKSIYNLYPMFSNNIRFGVEGVMDCLYFGDSYFAILGSDFGDNTIYILVKYVEYRKNNTVLNKLELCFIPDLGKINYDYWLYCLKVIQQHIDTPLSIVDLADGSVFPKYINDAQQIATRYKGGYKYVQDRILKRKIIKSKKRSYSLPKLL